MTQEYKGVDVEKFSKLIEDKNILEFLNYIDNHNVIDIADALSSLDVEDVAYVFNRLENKIAGEIFSYLDIHKQIELGRALSAEKVAGLLENNYTDDVVLFLEELEKDEIRKILDFANPEQRNLIMKVLDYPDNSAGTIMTTHFIDLGPYSTVKEAMELIKATQELAESIDNCYVTDSNHELIGVVSIRDILFAQPEMLIEEIMTKDVVSVNVRDNQEDVANLMGEYDLAMIPVVDDIRRCIGAIMADDVLDIVEEEATEDMQKMSGIAPLEGSYLHTPAKTMAKSRIFWLLVLMVAYAFSSLIITRYNDLIVMIPSLMTFVPLLMDTAGDAGSQALAMVVRGIAVDGLGVKDFFTVVWKEFRVALLCGLALFFGNMIRIMFFSANTGNFWLALVVSLTVFGVVIFSKLVGGILPLIALVLKQDPAAMASPMITTVCDSVSLLLYFSLATMFLGKLV